MSERFAGRTNEWCFKLFMACNDDIHNALESLDHRDLSPEGYHQFGIHQNERLSVVLVLQQRSWGRVFPPITGPLTLHIQRAHYVVMIWRKAGESHPSLPSPVDCGWEFDTTRQD